jgi:hypothetical protein
MGKTPHNISTEYPKRAKKCQCQHPICVASMVVSIGADFRSNIPAALQKVLLNDALQSLSMSPCHIFIHREAWV